MIAELSHNTTGTLPHHWKLHSSIGTHLADHSQRRVTQSNNLTQFPLHKILNRLAMERFHSHKLLLLAHFGPKDGKVIHAIPCIFIKLVESPTKR